MYLYFRCGHVVRDFESEAKIGVTFNSDKLGSIILQNFQN